MSGSRLKTTTLSKLREEAGFQQITEVVGEEPLEFKDHTPLSNWGMEDLLKLDELVSTVGTEIIPPVQQDYKSSNPTCADGSVHERDD